MGLQEDNKNLKQSISKMETERKQAQERNNVLEKVSPEPALFMHIHISVS